MSHTMNIKTELKDANMVRRTAKKLGLRCWDGETTLYRNREKGICIQLPNWNYPIVVNNGNVAYDNYNGNWGNEKELTTFIAHYGLEVAKNEAMLKGYSCMEGYDEANDELTLTIQVGGGF